MIPYVGGKYYLARKIISFFPKDYPSRFKRYVEPMGGGGWVLFKKQPNPSEIYNDINGDLVNLFRQIRDNYDTFKEKLSWTLYSREEFEAAKQDIQDPVLRAVYFALRICAIRDLNSKSFRITHAHKPNFLAFKKRLEAIRDRLQGVIIEHMDFATCIEKYDSDSTLFYIDPPYDIQPVNNYYSTPWTVEDTKRLAAVVKNIKGVFFLSNYPTPLIKSLFKDYKFIYLEHTNSIQRVKRQEVLITNWR